MANFNCFLPDKLLQQLDEKSIQLALPKEELIDRAFYFYLDHLICAEYEESYKQMVEDTDLLEMAEEGMEDYLGQLSEN